MSDLVKQVHRAYKAFAARDFDTIAELSDPEVEFTSLVMESEGTLYRGRDGLREYLERLVDVLPDWRPEIEEVEDHGDRMLVRNRLHATPPGGSVPVEQVAWQVIRFRNGLAIRWDFFRTEEEARGALAA
jgi:ketosteroid isomerase-like protein